MATSSNESQLALRLTTGISTYFDSKCIFRHQNRCVVVRKAFKWNSGHLLWRIANLSMRRNGLSPVSWLGVCKYRSAYATKAPDKHKVENKWTSEHLHLSQPERECPNLLYVYALTQEHMPFMYWYHTLSYIH